MKLSEAIRMNGMMKPQGFREESMYSIDQPCALGGALQSIGLQAINGGTGYMLVREIWPWVGRIEKCPDCDCEWEPRGAIDALMIIWHLNDKHRWSRSQIADWVETVEPNEISEPGRIQESLAEPEKQEALRR